MTDYKTLLDAKLAQIKTSKDFTDFMNLTDNTIKSGINATGQRSYEFDIPAGLPTDLTFWGSVFKDQEATVNVLESKLIVNINV